MSTDTATFITNMSLYIPYVFQNITGNRIAYLFEQYIGKVSRVDLVSKFDRRGKFYNVAYIHFDYWYDNTATRNIQSRVLHPYLDARFVYEDPWHWILLENKGKKHITGGAGRKQCINLTDFAENVPTPAIDQDYFLESNYIPDYRNKNIFHTREYVMKRIQQNNERMDELTCAENYPISRRDETLYSCIVRENDHYEDWIEQPKPKVYVDDNMEQILNEMDEVERWMMDSEEQSYFNFEKDTRVAMTCN
jgi:hypothetical protein